MKLSSKIARLASLVGFIVVAPMSQAGLVVENTIPAPIETPQPPAAKEVRPQGRDVTLSARVDRVAHMNRQRVDLESRLTSRITQSGQPPSELPIIRGFGHKVELVDALKQILPVGWKAYADQDLPEHSAVDWQGNRTWPMVLHSILESLDMRADVDWQNMELMLFVPPPAPPQPATVVAVNGTPVNGATQTATDANPIGAPQPAAAAPAPEAKVAAADPLPEPVKIAAWKLSTDKPLRENLRAWTSQAGWTLIWSAVNGSQVIDYPVDAEIEFSGELVGESGAIARVIAAYSDADYPLEVEFFRGNKVVEVRLHRVADVRGATPTPSVPKAAVPREPVPPPPAPPAPQAAQPINSFASLVK